MLCVRHFQFVIDVVCHGMIYILKQAIQLVLSRYCILRISYDEPVSPDHHKIRNANYLSSSQHNVSSSMLPILDTHCDNSHAFVCVYAQKQTVLIRRLQWQKVLEAVLPYFRFDYAISPVAGSLIFQLQNLFLSQAHNYS